jgi:hypothetical protein
MNYFKFTPGPWVIRTQIDHTINEDAAIAIDSSEECRDYVAFLRNVKSISVIDSETIEANAKLIAAAPDLLEALVDLLNVDEIDTVSVHKAQIKANAAIEKATK